MSGAITVSGQVLDVEFKSGTFQGSSGDNINWAHNIVKVLTGSDVCRVKFKAGDNTIQPPKVGDHVSVEVALEARGKDNLQITALRYSAPAAVHKAS